jgi:hypothetical protein
MYQFIIYGVAGVFYLVWGVVLLKGKALLISRRIDMLLPLLVLTAPIVNLLFDIPEFMPDSYTHTIIALILGFFIIAVGLYIFFRGRYIVINAKKPSVLAIIIGVLDEKSINNKFEDDSIKILDYDNSEILVWGFANTFEVSLKGVRGLTFYKDLILSIKAKTKKIQERVFPVMGLLAIIVGALLVFISYKFYLVL